MDLNQFFMKEALKEAQKAQKIGDVPVGAVIVYKNKIIARAHNKKESKKNAILHAEIIAINKACKKLKTWHLENCIIYVTLEPCMMCTGALIQSRIQKIVYATQSPKFGYIDSLAKLEKSQNNHIPIIERQVCCEEASTMLQNFFRNKRK